MKELKHDFEIISHLRTEDKEYRTCFACHQLFPVKRMEQHHFPIPKRYDGVDTIWLCLACHDFVDRITIGKWPENFMANAMSAGREHKLLMLKLWSVYTDLRFGGEVTKEASRVGEKIGGKQPSLSDFEYRLAYIVAMKWSVQKKGGIGIALPAKLMSLTLKSSPI